MNHKLIFIIVLCLAVCVCRADNGRFGIVGHITNGGLDNAEIVQFSPIQKLLITTNSSKEVIDFYQVKTFDPIDIFKLNSSIDTNGEITSIAIIYDKSILLAAVKDKLKPNQDNGRLLVVDIHNEHLGNILMTQSTGVCPDSIAVSPDGKWAVVANEAEFDDKTEGFISVFDLSNIENISDANLPLRHYRLKDLDSIINTDKGKIEPEYVCFDRQSRFAAISCQENSAVIFVDFQQDKPAIAGCIQLPKGSNPDGIALIDGINTDDGINGTILGIAEEGDSNDINSPFGQSVSFYWINSDNLRFGSIELFRDKICNLLGQECNKRYDPESITMFKYQNEFYASFTVERLNSVLILNITDPIKPEVVNLIEVGKRPEGIINLSLQGRQFIITANEGKNTYPLTILSDSLESQ